MNVTAITKFKQAEIYAALQRLGWSQSELARRTNISPGHLGRIINLREKPSETYATRIQNAFGEAGVFLDVLSLWPEAFTGMKKGFKVEQTAEVECENLLGCAEAMNIPQLEYDPEGQDWAGCVKVEDLHNALAELPARLDTVLRMRFMEGKTLEQAGQQIGVTRERVRQMEAQALRMLRHPWRIQRYAPHMLQRAKERQGIPIDVEVEIETKES